MSKEDKEKAVRHVALEYAKSDRSSFNFENANPPAARSYTTVNTGSAGANLNDIHERIKQKGLQRAKDYAGGGYPDNSLQMSDLNGDELEVVLKATQNKDLKPEEVKVIVEDNGRIGVYNKGDGKRLVYLNQTGTNLSKQANVKGKAASVEKGNESYKPVTADKPTQKRDKNKNPLDLDF